MKTLAVIGLGYVGLPLAVEFGKKYEVIGFDIYEARINELKEGYDRTLEVDKEELLSAQKLSYTTNLEDLKKAQIFIVTVPTPIDNYNKPDLTPLKKASTSVGKVLKKGDIVIYESTVYPGCTEEDCVPILEEMSGLKFNVDFFCGYSPERINPGDKEHRLPSIKKVTSGSTPEIAEEVNNLYASIITAGTHKASSIKVAEAAKVIENSQRDINIAFVNELSLIFDKMGIDTLDVLEAAGTKWNFLPFRPGLVGGHCISVDPYYLTHKAESLGYHSQVILAGRHINDNMGIVVANKVIKLMIKNSHQIVGSKVAILGITFKENCPDIRNSRVVDIIKELQEFDCCVDIFDPWADSKEVKHEYNLTLKDMDKFKLEDYKAVIVAVSHDEFKKYDFSNKGKTIIYDLKGILPKEQVDGRL
ncbi:MULTISPECIES: Vi polysaccharide biosynthesis UDP-N-acetylglucosamine C-6 dehydrogenase TviB [Helicobacter]|uniref:Vi polysaccharide biosynthesis UDP-N-acetylglucosamine C-6 dehydrogenase TviB n=1 Tax=Helicobacter ibis TaxID=2962633 RepID=A0ABT4VF84_9HELI|nr:MULTISPECIES: Vi polysaccharide biosynthesis UDP-N-acetylglucosamine C-6 dehydrogenase TviB [Helicobacter]MDA3967658.1 Vi polysaccharide biosynthesis UDP-N-acetylglucosamine C-6 dehydrogenase TviB [Helicobacter sp. WB40]MDA3969377.1 Vi polysaccharide biosynthesis UDP-N-acetylglucosamine C-6 dehydrogenase TviB [Helicobacter ibis]